MIGIMPVVPVMPRVVPFVLPPGLPAAFWLLVASVVLKMALIAFCIMILILMIRGD